MERARPARPAGALGERLRVPGDDPSRSPGRWCRRRRRSATAAAATPARPVRPGPWAGRRGRPRAWPRRRRVPGALTQARTRRRRPPRTRGEARRAGHVPRIARRRRASRAPRPVAARAGRAWPSPRRAGRRVRRRPPPADVRPGSRPRRAPGFPPASGRPTAGRTGSSSRPPGRRRVAGRRRGGSDRKRDPAAGRAGRRGRCRSCASLPGCRASRRPDVAAGQVVPRHGHDVRRGPAADIGPSKPTARPATVGSCPATRVLHPAHRSHYPHAPDPFPAHRHPARVRPHRRIRTRRVRRTVDPRDLPDRRGLVLRRRSPDLLHRDDRHVQGRHRAVGRRALDHPGRPNRRHHRRRGRLRRPSTRAASTTSSASPGRAA